MNSKEKREARLRRHTRVRKSVSGTTEVPRLNVFRSNKAIYAQVIDDTKGETLVSSSTLELKIKNGGNIEAACAVGKDIAAKCKKAKINKVVFDRGGFLYHGRVAALADAAREAGLEFEGGIMAKELDKQKNNLLEEKVINIGRVTKVTQGGRHFRFSATVAVGNRKGLIGIGTGKANEVPEAIKKALQAANKNVVKISLVDNRTIPHEATYKVGRAVVLLKPAKEGRGIIAGGAARAVLELAGVKDIVAKSLGSNTQVNVAKATLGALTMQRTKEHIAELRSKKVEEL